jgi:hypothetical protein
LKTNHPDYRYITISLDRLEALLVNNNISLSFPSIVDELIAVKESLFTTADLPPPNSQSIVLNLNIITTEIDLLLVDISRYISLLPGLLVLSIRSTPLDKITRQKRIFAIVFFTLYPTGRADFNTTWQKKIDLNDYACYMICYYNRRFGQYSR